MGNEPALLGKIPHWPIGGISVKWDKIVPYERAIPPVLGWKILYRFNCIGVRHRILQDVRSRLNSNKLRQMPRIITANTTNKRFDGAMLACYCAKFVPVLWDENNCIWTQKIFVALRWVARIAGLTWTGLKLKIIHSTYYLPK